jgi:hypothetical protein
MKGYESLFRLARKARGGRGSGNPSAGIPFISHLFYTFSLQSGRVRGAYTYYNLEIACDFGVDQSSRLKLWTPRRTYDMALGVGSQDGIDYRPARVGQMPEISAVLSLR